MNASMDAVGLFLGFVDRLADLIGRKRAKTRAVTPSARRLFCGGHFPLRWCGQGIIPRADRAVGARPFRGAAGRVGARYTASAMQGRDRPAAFGVPPASRVGAPSGPPPAVIDPARRQAPGWCCRRRGGRPARPAAPAARGVTAAVLGWPGGLDLRLLGVQGGPPFHCKPLAGGCWLCWRLCGFPSECHYPTSVAH
jgi:hypothetical protein